MNLLKYILSSFLYLISTCVGINTINNTKLFGITCLLTEAGTFSSKDIFVVSFAAFIDLFVVSFTIYSILKVIFNTIMFWSSLFFLNFKEKTIHLHVDQDNIIHGSFVELRNGKIIPINIRRIVTREPDKESGEQVNNE